MANRAFLIGGTENTPIGPTTEGYDPDTQVLCAASYQIPAFWLFCFDECNQSEFVAEGEHIPTAFTDTASARDRLAERAPLATELFAAHRNRWEEWIRFIGACEFPYLTLDGYELWAMGPDEFAAHLPRALRWFKSGSQQDQESLFWLAGIERYEPMRRAIVCEQGECPGRFLQGYSWVREVPWNENAEI
jgi:hypothetical protein